MLNIEHELFLRATASLADPRGAPKALLLFAHPDDEVVALGARLSRFSESKLIHATDGSPRNEQDSRAHGFAGWLEYRDARRRELESALTLAGIPVASCGCLNIPDQQAGLNLVAFTHEVARLIREERPAVIFTHPYEGGHPDHDACAFAVYHAVRLVEKCQTAPLLIEAAFYHAGPDGIETGVFLPGERGGQAIDFELTTDEGRRKLELLACFVTQQATLRYFSIAHERFRIAPAYEFSQPPHAGPVFYDQYPWGMRSERFCELATQAKDSLNCEAVLA